MRKQLLAVAAVLSIGLMSFTASAQTAPVEGSVVKIDESAGKITLKHGPIKKLDMDEGMTMVFRVQDPAV
ncbi:MAG: copper-binding protein, partial [Afipia sp.]|nr:copper-binding protein [Afipia sp.]